MANIDFARIRQILIENKSKKYSKSPPPKNIPFSAKSEASAKKLKYNQCLPYQELKRKMNRDEVEWGNTYRHIKKQTLKHTEVTKQLQIDTKSSDLVDYYATAIQYTPKDFKHLVKVEESIDSEEACSPKSPTKVWFSPKMIDRPKSKGS